MTSPRTSLVVGERVVSRCYDGLLEVEYALFEAHEVIMAAAPGHGAREQGYLTTAGFARDRLRAAKVTSTLARDTMAALRGHLRALARAPFMVHLLDQLTPCEAFEGGVFEPATHTYKGTWLDLGALAEACPLNGAAHLMQALHLLLVLEEVADDVPVRLLTSEITSEMRAGARTWTKIRFDGAGRLPWVLRSMRVVPARLPQPTRVIDGELRDELLTNLRARATASPASRARLHALATEVARGRTPSLGLTASSVDSASDALKQTPIPKSLELGVTDRGVDAAVTADPLQLFEELRSHTELLRGEGHIRDVAAFLSAMSDKSAQVPDLAILAARAWLAAGETGHARHLAKKLVWAETAPDNVRMLALEILKSTVSTNESTIPPPVIHIEPKPIVMLASEPDREAPVGASLPIFTSDNSPPAILIPPAPKVPSIQVVAGAAPPPTSSPSETRSAPPEPEKCEALVAVPRFRPRRPEIVETMSLPEGLTEDLLAEGATPQNPVEARIAMIRQARTLGRDYRIWYGTTLMTNAMAIETMQRHLRRRFSGKDNERGEKKLEKELTRHGALLSEILARSLGAEWVDVSHASAGHWAMILPPSLRIWPIGRVYRFFRQGHREADLVAFYLDLEAQSRTEAT